MKLIGWISLFLVLGLWDAASMADQSPNRGAAQIVLPGGSSGNVPFPHHRHQENQADCMTCHELFPQEPGSVEQLKSEGKLQAKQVMNKLCVKCHRELKRANQPSGPVTCKTCHIKE